MLGQQGPRFVDTLEKINLDRIAGLNGKQVAFLKKIPLARIKANGRSSVTLKHENEFDPFCQVALSMTDAQNLSGKRRRVAWWIVVGSELTGRVVSAKRISVPGKDRSVKVDIPVSDDGRKYKVFLISDCYFGIDQEIVI